MRLIRQIISGGQTGADRGGLDAGLALGLPVGGMCPKHRRAEDGRVPDRYPLAEHPSYDYPPRTMANVRAAHATVIFTYGPPERGTLLTRELAERAKKPHLVLDLSGAPERHVHIDHLAAMMLHHWLETVSRQVHRAVILNVAGPRESRAPGIQTRTASILMAALQDNGEDAGRAPQD